MKASKSDIEEIIIGYLTGNASLDEKAYLVDWINQSAENKSYFSSYRDIWLATAQISKDELGLLLPEVHQVKQTNTEKQQKSILLRSSYKMIMRFAAATILAIGTGLLGYWLNTETPKTIAYQNDVVFEAVAGSRAITVLPDGSKVWLNGGSKLTYASNFNIESREVNLIGEAYFDVNKNPAKPFVVKAGLLSIKALGTIFNVKAYPEDNTITTTLVEGKVVVEGTDKANKPFSVTMHPEEKVTFNITCLEVNGYGSDIEKDSNKDILNHGNGSQKNEPLLVKEKVVTELYTSWKDDRWIIERQNLDLFSKDLERRYNVKIIIQSPNIKKFHFTGIIQNETIEQILVIMRHTIPIQYTLDKGIITIDEDEQLMNEFNMIN